MEYNTRKKSSLFPVSRTAAGGEGASKAHFATLEQELLIDN